MEDYEKLLGLQLMSDKPKKKKKKLPKRKKERRQEETKIQQNIMPKVGQYKSGDSLNE